MLADNVPHGRIQFFGFDSPAKMAYLTYIPKMHFSKLLLDIWRLLQTQAENLVCGNLTEYVFLSLFDLLCISAETQNDFVTHSLSSVFFPVSSVSEQPTVSCSILHNFPSKSSNSSAENTSILELGSRKAASMESSSVLKHWKSVPFRIQTAFQIYLLILFIRVICS